MIKFFSSMKVGLALIALLALSSIVATLNPQTTIYSSFWFRGLLFLLCINLFICTSKRIPSLYRKLTKNISDEDLAKLNLIKAKEVSDSQYSLVQLKEYLEESGFRYNIKTNKSKSLIFANKGTMDLIAPHIIHISLLVIVIGAIIGNLGSSESVKCFVNETAVIPSNISEGLVLEISDFKTLYDKNNDISNWQSDLILYKDNQTIAEGNTRVNKPFKFKGIKFYQSAYGYEHVVNVNMGGQNRSVTIANNQPIEITDDLVIVFTEQGNEFVLNKYKNRKLVETIKLEPQKKIVPVNGLEMIYEKLKPYSVLKIKTDPGLYIVMFGFIMLSLGFIVSWLGSYKELKIGIDHGKNLLDISIYTKDKILKEKLWTDLQFLTRGTTNE